MKTLRDKVEQFVVKAEGHWNALSVEKQRLMTKVFFGSYVLLTVIVLINVIISMGQRQTTMPINHIDGILTNSAGKALEQNETPESSIKK